MGKIGIIGMGAFGTALAPPLVLKQMSYVGQEIATSLLILKTIT